MDLNFALALLFLVQAPGMLVILMFTMAYVYRSYKERQTNPAYSWKPPIKKTITVSLPDLCFIALQDATGVNREMNIIFHGIHHVSESEQTHSTYIMNVMNVPHHKCVVVIVRYDMIDHVRVVHAVEVHVGNTVQTISMVHSYQEKELLN